MSKDFSDEFGLSLSHAREIHTDYLSGRAVNAVQLEFALAILARKRNPLSRLDHVRLPQLDPLQREQLNCKLAFKLGLAIGAQQKSVTATVEVECTIARFRGDIGKVRGALLAAQLVATANTKITSSRWKAQQWIRIADAVEIESASMMQQKQLVEALRTSFGKLFVSAKLTLPGTPGYKSTSGNPSYTIIIKNIR